MKAGCWPTIQNGDDWGHDELSWWKKEFHLSFNGCWQP